MNDKELIARGAECVAGDLVLHRQVVGHYRNGQFVITPEGADILQNVVDVEAVEVTEQKPAQRAKPRKGVEVKAAEGDEPQAEGSAQD